MYKCRIVDELQGTWPALVDAVTLLCCYKSSLFSRADSLWLVMSTTDREPLQQHWPNTGYISMNLDLGIDICMVPFSFSFHYIVDMSACLCCISADNPVMAWQIFVFSFVKTNVAVECNYVRHDSGGLWFMYRPQYVHPLITPISCLIHLQLVLCSAPSVSQPVFTITERAPTRAFPWLKALWDAVTFIMRDRRL